MLSNTGCHVISLAPRSHLCLSISLTLNLYELVSIQLNRWVWSFSTSRTYFDQIWKFWWFGRLEGSTIVDVLPPAVQSYSRTMPERCHLAVWSFFFLFFGEWLLFLSYTSTFCARLADDILWMPENLKDVFCCSRVHVHVAFNRVTHREKSSLVIMSKSKKKIKC